MDLFHHTQAPADEIVGEQDNVVTLRFHRATPGGRFPQVDELLDRLNRAALDKGCTAEATAKRAS